MISLTFDDGLDCHLDKAVPILERYGLRGTFYVPVGGEEFERRHRDWRAAAQALVAARAATAAAWGFGLREVNPNTAENKIKRERWLEVCRDCHDEEMARDKNVFLVGEDIADDAAGHPGDDTHRGSNDRPGVRGKCRVASASPVPTTTSLPQAPASRSPSSISRICHS